MNNTDAKIIELFTRQAEFQRLMGLPIDSDNPKVKDRLAEIFLFKAIEEIVELRKTQPSGLIEHKITPIIDRGEMIGELVDTFLFLVNFMLVRDIPFEELLKATSLVQEMNFQKKLKKIREEQR